MDRNLIFTFDEERFLEAAGIVAGYPKGRGVYVNPDKTFMIWVNEQDHLRVFSMESSPDIKEVFTRIADAMHILDENFKFVKSEKYGYLTSALTDIGTTLRISVHVRLP